MAAARWYEALLGRACVRLRCTGELFVAKLLTLELMYLWFFHIFELVTVNYIYYIYKPMNMTGGHHIVGCIWSQKWGHYGY